VLSLPDEVRSPLIQIKGLDTLKVNFLIEESAQGGRNRSVHLDFTRSEFGRLVDP